jgi:hypothetical protein
VTDVSEQLTVCIIILKMEVVGTSAIYHKTAIYIVFAVRT